MSKNVRRRCRKSRLPLLLLLLAASAIFFYWSNHSLQVAEVTYSSPALPAAFDGFTIVQLSDLHGAKFGEDNERLLSAVEAAQPDAVVLTGDLLDRFRRTPHSYAVELGAALSEIAPTYFITGNHEWSLPDVPGLKEKLRAAGVTVLSNEYVSLEREGETILLAGIDDPNGYADQKTPEALAEEIKGAFGDPFWVLLAHRNNYFSPRYSRLGADLVVSGHGHGGLIRLPFTDGLISVERTLFPSYTAGFYSENGSTLFVSRGLGNSGRSFRLFNRPEVVVLTLIKGGAL